MKEIKQNKGFPLVIHEAEKGKIEGFILSYGEIIHIPVNYSTIPELIENLQSIHNEHQKPVENA